MENVIGPGLISYFSLEYDGVSGFESPVKWEDCQGNIKWNCGVCKITLPFHTHDCPVHAAYLASERQKQEYVRPDWQCSGCDQPKEGPHRFSCYERGSRASQLVLPVTQNPDGTFSVDPPYSTSKP